MSFHARELDRGGLVRHREDGGSMIYVFCYLYQC